MRSSALRLEQIPLEAMKRLSRIVSDAVIGFATTAFLRFNFGIGSRRLGDTGSGEFDLGEDGLEELVLDDGVLGVKVLEFVGRGERGLSEKDLAPNFFGADDFAPSRFMMGCNGDDVADGTDRLSGLEVGRLFSLSTDDLSLRYAGLAAREAAGRVGRSGGLELRVGAGLDVLADDGLDDVVLELPVGFKLSLGAVLFFGDSDNFVDGNIFL